MVLGAAVPGLAQPARDAARTRVAVLIVGTDEASREAADGLSELLIGEVAARGGMTIVGKEEFQARLGQGDQGTLECVSSTPCMGRVGVQLGVREVIAGTLARRGDAWVFNLNRLDVHRGEVLTRAFREVDGALGDVADALAATVPELFRAPGEEGIPPPPLFAGLVLRGPAGAEAYLDGELLATLSHVPFETAHLAPGSHELRVEARGHEPWTRTVSALAGETTQLEVILTRRMRELPSPWFYATASTAVAALGVAIGLGIASQSNLDLSIEQRTEARVTRAEAIAFYEARGVEATVANVLFGVAAAAAAAAITVFFFPDRVPVDDHNEPNTAALRLRIAPSSIQLEGAF